MNLHGETSANEPDLIRHALQGNGAAWEVLVRSHQEPVFRLAYLLLGDADEAEDATQETFIRAYRSLERFDLARPLRPWLLSIAANLARNRRRSMGRYFAALQRLLVSEPGSRASIEEKSFQNLEAQLLWQALRRLGQTDQQVVYLRYFLNMSIEETAETMHIAQGTVKSRLHRAMDRLRAIIERDFPGLREAGFEGAAFQEGSDE